MKAVLCFLLALGAAAVAWADVKIEYRDITGATSTMLSNGKRVRINGGQMPGYLLVDGASGEFFMVDPQRNEILRVAPDEMGVMAEAGALNVGLKARGGSERIAGYATGRYDLLANGELCGTIYGSTELMENAELKRMFKAMQGMHKISHGMKAGISSYLTDCQRANARLAELANTSGFVLRVDDDKGKRTFEVLSLDTDTSIEPGEFELPQGMPVVDWREKLKATPQQIQQMKQQQQQQQMQKMNEMIKQLQQSGGEMTPEIQQQMQKMMEQMQNMQQQPQ